MPRPTRRDGPRTLHHVMNRAVGRRPLFETADDIGSFESCIVASIKRGEIRVQSFAFLTTHFHLLVESVVGELSEALRRIESEYVFRFNRRHDRDGPLVRGRFCSKIVDHSVYWSRLIRYIDDNPVDAGLVSDPVAYPHCSAHHYAHSDGPHWLDREPVERFVLAHSGGRPYGADEYRRLFRRPQTASERAWIEDRVLRGDRHEDAFSNLIDAAPEVVRQRLVERARIADGMRPGVPILDVDTLLAAIGFEQSRRPTWLIGDGKRRRSAWDVIQVGLLRTLCEVPFRAIAELAAVPISTAQTRCAAHACLLQSDAEYEEVVTQVVRRALQEFGDWASA
jgi:hypothetical protein